MKNVLKTAFVALALTAGAAISPAAQLDIVNVPFDFVANGTAMPAGKYTVESSDTFVRIIGNRGQTATVLTYGGVSVKQKDSKMRLVLKQQNGRMHLVGVRDNAADVLRSVSSGS